MEAMWRIHVNSAEDIRPHAEAARRRREMIYCVFAAPKRCRRHTKLLLVPQVHAGFISRLNVRWDVEEQRALAVSPRLLLRTTGRCHQNRRRHNRGYPAAHRGLR